MSRPARALPVLVALLTILLLRVDRPVDVVRAQSSAPVTPTPPSSPGPTATATFLPASAPSLAILDVDMLRHVGGVFFSTRHIRIGNLARYIVRYRTSGLGKRVPTCEISFTHNGVTFYEDDMWHMRGKKICYLDGRFHAVVGTLIATFTLRLGTETVSATLPFHVKLPKF